MSVSPRDLLREARNAAERENEETARRQAISTAYYAAYHAAREYHNNLPRPGRSKQGVGEHENLIHQLRNPDSTLSEEIRNHSTKVGDLLLRLRPSRIRAHYELQAEIAIREMRDAIELAAQILNLANLRKP